MKTFEIKLSDVRRLLHILTTSKSALQRFRSLKRKTQRIVLRKMGAVELNYMEIKTICAWCKKDMSTKEYDGPNEIKISHGMCESCQGKIRATFPKKKGSDHGFIR